MIEELRRYVAAPGKRDALIARFKNDTMALFKKHGITVTAFWTVPNDGDTLYYMCRFADAAACDAAWKTFLADPAWLAVKDTSERDGPLVASLKGIQLERVDGFPTA
jgi:NIPSNAP